MTAPTATASVFPDHYNFPPFFTRQSNEATWAAQRSIWSTFILDYCRLHKLWRLHVSDTLETDLFWNKKLNRRLNQKDALALLDSMASENKLEWDGTTGSRSTAIVYWRTPEEWANAIYEWIDNTGQKGSVLTLYEISEGDLTVSQEFHGIDSYILRKAMDVLVKRGSAQVFGASEEERGVKFF